MKKARFDFTLTQDYSEVPIPNNIPDNEILDYIKEHIDNFDKYRISIRYFDENNAIYQAIIEDEDGSEYTIIADN